MSLKTGIWDGGFPTGAILAFGIVGTARRALELSVSMAARRVNAQTVLAQVLLARNRAADALPIVLEAVRGLESGVHLEEGEALLYLAHAETLDANGRRDDARRVIRAARDRLLERAAMIARPEWRESFLTKVPENARTLALAREWLGEG